MIEEIETLPHEVQSVAYAQAREWLRAVTVQTQSRDFERSERRSTGLEASQKAVDMPEILFNKPYDLKAELLNFERGLISQALAKVNGKVTHAAKLVGVGYQTLASIIETKHPNLLKKRTPVDRRPRKR